MGEPTIVVVGNIGINSIVFQSYLGDITRHISVGCAYNVQLRPDHSKNEIHVWSTTKIYKKEEKSGFMKTIIISYRKKTRMVIIFKN